MKKNESKRKGCGQCALFLWIPIFHCALKCRLAFRNTLQEPLPWLQNIIYPHDKGCCFTRNPLQLLLKREVIKEHMPRSLHPPPPPLDSFLCGPDGRTARVNSRDASVDPGWMGLSESEAQNQRNQRMLPGPVL